MFLQTYLYRYIILFLISVAFFTCTFNTDNNEQLTFTPVNHESDTVSIWPQLGFAFSKKLRDSVVQLVITPDPGPQYSTFLNEFKDTLYFKVTGVLEGNTTYTITLKDLITSENGKILYPEDFSVTFITRSKENEPNNFILLADTLFSVCYGTISLVNDTDFYCISQPIPSTIYLKCHYRLAGFKIIDSSGSIINKQTGSQTIKQYPVSKKEITSFYVCVFSLSDNNARYELGITNKLEKEYTE